MTAAYWWGGLLPRQSEVRELSFCACVSRALLCPVPALPATVGNIRPVPSTLWSSPKYTLVYGLSPKDSQLPFKKRV
jgi:hypothetical protein